MWEHYRYTNPIAEALTAEFGTSFALMNTGGGCICLQADLEGGIYLLIGCAVDGPLLHDDERQHYAHGGGYGVGVYDTEDSPYSGGTLAYAVDYQAENAGDVIALVKRALSMMPGSRTPDSYVMRERDVDGNVSEKIYRN